MLVYYFFFLHILSFRNEPHQIPEYQLPVKIPVTISGNFGEIRPDHFHTGIDIKTQGITGHKIYSIDQGYVSRIRIQPGGYGKALYIDHPGGVTSVYGHLDGFNEKIDPYVKEAQYRQSSHSVDIYPQKNELTVIRGEFVAISGNSGSSNGPHLHFEIRKTVSQIPVNPLKNGIDVPDETPPKMLSLFVYPQGQNYTLPLSPVEYKLKKINGTHVLSASSSISIPGQAGFGLEVYDNIDGSSNQCGIYILELSIAGKVLYLFRTDEFSFDESKYVNAHSDYSIEVSDNRSIHLLFRKPNNRLSMYPVMVDDGIFEFQPGIKYPIRIRTEDASGNQSILEFDVEGLPVSRLADGSVEKPSNLFRWNSINYFENSDIRLEIPARSLYEDMRFEYGRTDSKKTFYPYIHFIGSTSVPIHSSARLSVFGGNIPASLRSRTILVKLDDEDEPSAQPVTWKDDWLSTRISGFGRYTVDADTIPPEILPLNIKPGADMNGQPGILISSVDKLTGIKVYNGFIDDQWVLFEYDPKNDLISYTFDRSRLKSGTDHKLRFYVRDGAGNQSFYQTSFYW